MAMSETAWTKRYGAAGHRMAQLRLFDPTAYQHVLLEAQKLKAQGERVDYLALIEAHTQEGKTDDKN